MNETTKMPRVVIVGGGFAGLRTARALAKEKVQVTVVDHRNHHLFQPLLYQVATAVLEFGDIATPLRALVGRQKNTEVLLAEARGVDVHAKKVVLEDGLVPYDYLVLATGATHSYFGRDEWAKYTLALKTLEDAREIRRRVLFAFELAEREKDPDLRRRLLTFVIIGAGPTGVEMAGALAEVARLTLRGEFKHIDPSQARVVLVEGMSRVLPTYPEALSEKALRSLERLGVEVMTGTRVTEIDAECVRFGDRALPSQTVVWAAGVAASPVARSLGVPLDRAGRVQVTPELTVPGHPEIFVVGDLASLEQDGKPIPGIAPAAIQMGTHVAKNLRRRLRGKPERPFHYRDKGYFAVIGRGHAVGIAGKKLQMSGVIAWMAWLFIHIMYLVGFRNRAAVLVDWAYSFFTWRRGVRVVTGPPPLRREAGTQLSAEAMSSAGTAGGAGTRRDETLERVPSPSPPG